MYSNKAQFFFINVNKNAHYATIRMLIISWLLCQVNQGRQPMAEDAENFRCGGGLLNYVQILYGKKGSQQKYDLEVP